MNVLSEDIYKFKSAKFARFGYMQYCYNFPNTYCDKIFKWIHLQTLKLSMFLDQSGNVRIVALGRGVVQ